MKSYGDLEMVTSRYLMERTALIYGRELRVSGVGSRSSGSSMDFSQLIYRPETLSNLLTWETTERFNLSFPTCYNRCNARNCQHKHLNISIADLYETCMSASPWPWRGANGTPYDFYMPSKYF